MESERFSMKLKITSTQQDIEITVWKGITFEELNSECQKAIGELVDLKIIYRGKILKENDDLSLLKEGQTLYIVKEQKKPVESSVPTPAPSTIASGAGNMTGLLHGLNHFGVMNQARSMMNDIDSMQSNDLESMMDPNQLALISQMMGEIEAFLSARSANASGGGKYRRRKLSVTHSGRKQTIFFQLNEQLPSIDSLTNWLLTDYGVFFMEKARHIMIYGSCRVFSTTGFSF